MEISSGNFGISDGNEEVIGIDEIFHSLDKKEFIVKTEVADAVLTEESLNLFQVQAGNLTIDLTSDDKSNCTESCVASVIDSKECTLDVKQEFIVESFVEHYENKLFSEIEAPFIEISQEPEMVMKIEPRDNDFESMEIFDEKSTHEDNINSNVNVHRSVDNKINIVVKSEVIDESKAIGTESIPIKRSQNKRLLKRRNKFSLGEEGNDNKKRMKSFEPPKLKDANRDIFCWKCHKFGGKTLLCCICPRIFHSKCSKLHNNKTDSWICDECTSISSVDENSCKIDSQLLIFVINKVRRHEFSSVFENPVNLEQYPDYEDYIVQPMCLSQLEMNIKNYHSCESFLADFKWIVHNSCIYNSVSNKLTTSIRAMFRNARNECEDIAMCAECYRHANVLDKETWFIEPCSIPHLLLWAKFRKRSHWPGKLMAATQNGICVRFFGDHSKAIIPPEACYLYSFQVPSNSVTMYHNLSEAIDEVKRHIGKILLKFRTFCYAPLKMLLNPHDLISQNKLMFPKLYEIENRDDSLQATINVTENFEDPYENPLVDPENDPLAIDSKNDDVIPVINREEKKTSFVGIISLAHLFTTQGYRLKEFNQSSKGVAPVENQKPEDKSTYCMEILPNIEIASHSAEKQSKNKGKSLVSGGCKNNHSVFISGVPPGKNKTSCSKNNDVMPNFFNVPSSSSGQGHTKISYYVKEKELVSNVDGIGTSKNHNETSETVKMTADNCSPSCSNKSPHVSNIKQVTSSKIFPKNSSDSTSNPTKMPSAHLFSPREEVHDNGDNFATVVSELSNDRIFDSFTEKFSKSNSEENTSGKADDLKKNLAVNFLGEEKYVEEEHIKENNIEDDRTKPPEEGYINGKGIYSERVNEMFDAIGEPRMKGPLSAKVKKLKKLLKIRSSFEEKVIKPSNHDEHVKIGDWCKVCCQESFYQCCLGTYYCSKKCMDIDWPNHKEACYNPEMPMVDKRMYFHLNSQSTPTPGLHDASGSHTRPLFKMNDAEDPHESFLSEQADIEHVPNTSEVPYNNLNNGNYLYKKLEERLSELMHQSIGEKEDYISNFDPNKLTFPKKEQKAEIKNTIPSESSVAYLTKSSSLMTTPSSPVFKHGAKIKTIDVPETSAIISVKNQDMSSSPQGVAENSPFNTDTPLNLANDLSCACQMSANDLSCNCQMSANDLSCACQMSANDLSCACQMSANDLSCACQMSANVPYPTSVSLTSSRNVVPVPSVVSSDIEISSSSSLEGNQNSSPLSICGSDPCYNCQYSKNIYNSPSVSEICPVISVSSSSLSEEDVNVRPLIYVRPLEDLLEEGSISMNNISVGSTLVSVGSLDPAGSLSIYTSAGSSKAVVKTTTLNP